MTTIPQIIDYSLAKKAIETWGAAAQIDMCIEECAELIDALCKYKRGRCSDDHVAEEIVDVTIMVTQMAALFDTAAQCKWFDIKVQRITNKLNTSTNAS